MPEHKILVTHHFNTTLKKICRELDIEFRNPHKMRPYSISAHLDNGATIAIVQSNHGHADPTTTNRYKGLTKSDNAIIDELNRTNPIKIAM